MDFVKWENNVSGCKAIFKNKAEEVPVGVETVHKVYWSNIERPERPHVDEQTGLTFDMARTALSELKFF